MCIILITCVNKSILIAIVKVLKCSFSLPLLIYIYSTLRPLGLLFRQFNVLLASRYIINDKNEMAPFTNVYISFQVCSLY